MHPERIKKILEEIHTGALSVEQALGRLKTLPFEELDFAVVDHHRHLRGGFPEVIFCSGKTPDQVVAIAERILSGGDNLLATRATAEMYSLLRESVEDAVYHPEARIISVSRTQPPAVRGPLAVICAGTSDIPVAEEAAVTAEVLGNRVHRVYDVGVAGLHRLLARREEITTARILIVVAGMEGALASVVGGLVDRPVIGVPTSIGYGANFGGVSALLTMLNSCTSGVTVVNIDNGFGAAFAASMMNRTD